MCHYLFDNYKTYDLRSKHDFFPTTKTLNRSIRTITTLSCIQLIACLRVIESLVQICPGRET